jgi:hypothetical protein
MISAKIADRQPGRLRRNAFRDQLADHPDKDRVRPYRRRADHFHAEFARQAGGFGIEIV